MSIDWDALVLSPVMAVFGEGIPIDDLSLPLYTPRGLAPFRLADAVFDRAYAEVVLDPDVGEVTNRKPCLGVRVSLFPRPPAQNDTVYIPSVDITFVVKDVQADGHGHAKLLLMATS
jgi:hypothetical protein